MRIESWMKSLDLVNFQGPGTLISNEVSDGADYAHEVRKAFQEIKIDALYCLQGVPHFAILEQSHCDREEVLKKYAALTVQENLHRQKFNEIDGMHKKLELAVAFCIESDYMSFDDAWTMNLFDKESAVNRRIIGQMDGYQAETFVFGVSWPYLDQHVAIFGEELNIAN